MKSKNVLCVKSFVHFAKRKYLFNMFSLVIIFLISSCSSIVSTPQEIQKVELKNFDWTPPSTATTKSSDIAIILVRPIYEEKFKDSKAPIYQRFSKNMGSDFEEMLIAKGYTIRGPYDTYDEIVFSDKSETDLMLEVEIDFSSTWANNAFKKSADALSAALGQTSYKYWLDGELLMGGKINLVIRESVTLEKLWIKSLKLSDKSIKVITNKVSASNDDTAFNQLVNSAGYLNPISTLLDEYYQQALTTAWNQLEPQELRALKKQVKELRSKKGY